MMRTIFTLVLTGLMSAAAVDVLHACGDKFIRIGREVRFGRYVAVYPAAILVYAPVGSAPWRVADLPSVLKRAGHAPTVVTSPAEMSAALRGGKFDLVLVGLAQADEVSTEARAASSHPDLLPVLVKGTADQIAKAKTFGTCRIEATAPHRNDALAEIDHRMELRLKDNGGTAVSKH